MLHLLVASYVRTVSQQQAINRFIRGQRVHARNCIEVMLTIKKEISLDSPDTCLKLLFRPNSLPTKFMPSFRTPLTKAAATKPISTGWQRRSTTYPVCL